MLLPGEFAAVDDGSAERGAVSAQKLRQRMHNDVGSIFDWPQQDRRGDGVVDDQRHPVFVSHLGQLLDIANVSRRVADTLTEDGARFVIDQLFDCRGIVGLSESNRDSLAGQNMREQRMSGSVELRNRHDIAAQFGDVQTA